MKYWFLVVLIFFLTSCSNVDQWNTSTISDTSIVTANQWEKKEYIWNRLIGKLFGFREKKLEQETLDAQVELDAKEVNIETTEKTKEAGSNMNAEIEEILEEEMVMNEILLEEERIMNEMLEEEKMMNEAIREDKEAETKLLAKKLSNFSKVSSTWWESLNKDWEIPNQWFTAIFFNTETQKVSKVSIQDTISVSGAFDLYSIPSEDFWAYFVGKIEILEKGIYEFYGTSGRSNTRLILDGRLIPGSSTMIELEPWSYILEAEHINDWHTVDFTAGYMKPIQKADMDTAVEALTDVRKIPNLKIWYAGVYESDTHSIDLSLDTSDSPVALVLSSYGSIQWNIDSNNIDVRAVIISELESGSSVSGVWDTPVYKMWYRDIPSLYDPVPSCSDAGWMFYCEWWLNEFEDLQKVTTKLLGNVPAGFAGEYSTSSFTLPGRVLDREEYQKIQEDKDEILERKKQTESKKGFNNMFN